MHREGLVAVALPWDIHHHLEEVQWGEAHQCPGLVGLVVGDPLLVAAVARPWVDRADRADRDCPHLRQLIPVDRVSMPHIWLTSAVVAKVVWVVPLVPLVRGTKCHDLVGQGRIMGLECPHQHPFRNQVTYQCRIPIVFRSQPLRRDSAISTNSLFQSLHQ